TGKDSDSADPTRPDRLLARARRRNANTPRYNEVADASGRFTPAASLSAHHTDQRGEASRGQDCRMPSWLVLLSWCCCALAVLLPLPAARAAPPPEDGPGLGPGPGPLADGFTDLPPTPYEPDPSTEAPEPAEPGCAPCRSVSCPRSAAVCPAGLAADPCGCCPAGVCGLREGARCYNASTGADLAARALGVCGEHMDCLARVDLGDKDKPEALCVCRDEGQVCGSDNTTYSSSCGMRLAGAAAGPDEPPVRVWLKHRGPCRAAPWVVTPPTPAQHALGAPVSLECEVKGYPAPAPSWERLSKEGIATPLPGDDASLVVMVRGGPEAFMASTWLQIMALRPEDAGKYICVAANSEGVARAAAEVTLAG
ncbi:Insulin-like growth factor-binding protein-related protein 1, partial [Frankliniella fusca]